MRRTFVAAVAVLTLASCSSSSSVAKPPPAGPRVQTRLVFSGAVTATAVGSVAVQPEFVAKGFDSSSNAPEWSTGCVFAGGDTAAWGANVTVQTPGNLWTVSISDGERFGNPSPGTYKGSFISEHGDPKTLSLNVSSKQPIADWLASAGATEYEYYAPMSHNSGAGVVTVDPGLRTGTIDVWLTPSVPNNLEFHLAGTWSCV